MVLIVERRDTAPQPTAQDPGPRSVERALRHMHWHFVPADASPLLQRRPLWDVLLVALSVGGTVISLSGVVLGWRRVRRKLGWHTPAAPQAPMR